MVHETREEVNIMKVQTIETAVLVVFAVTLIGCILAGIPILAALALGYLIFFAYTLSRGYTVRDIFRMSWKGIKTAKKYFNYAFYSSGC